MSRPNMLFIMPDQLRADFLSCYGASFIDTPHIDALGACGVRYERAYSEHPVCVAARNSLISGMNAIKTGVLGNNQGLRPDYRACGLNTWPELLNKQGYYTVATGKMHFYPWEERLGFQRRIIAEDKLWGFIEDDYYHLLKSNGYSKTSFYDVPAYHQNFGALVSPIPWEHSVDHFVGQETARWIDEYEGDQPFAMMVGFPSPHNPYDPAAEFAIFDPEHMPEPLPTVPADTALMRQHTGRGDSSRKAWYAIKNEDNPQRHHYMLRRAHYAGLVKQIDHEVGCIVEALRRKGVLDNTIIIFSSDHGDYLGDHGLSGKASFYQGACHVPLLVRHPALQNSAVSQDLVTLTDVTATLLNLAGQSVPGYMDSIPLPGLDLPDNTPRQYIAGFLSTSWMLFDGQWKFCKYVDGQHLFNLEEDPTEQHNRARDPSCADIVQRLDTQLTTEIMRSVGEAFFPQSVYTFSHSSNPDFGRVGWHRDYPMPWNQIHPD